MINVKQMSFWTNFLQLFDIVFIAGVNLQQYAEQV